MKIVIFMFVLYLNCSLADSFKESDMKYLSDLPSPTDKNFRWLVPADAWRFKNEHLLKGEYFKISSIKELDVYTKPSLAGSPALTLRGLIYKGKREVCEKSSYKRKDHDLADVLDCVHGSCRPLLSSKIESDTEKTIKKNYISNIFSDSDYLLNKKKYAACSIEIDYFYRYYNSNKSDDDSIYDYVKKTQANLKANHYLKIIEVAKDKSYVEVLVNGVKHYVDIRQCKDNPGDCQIVNIKFSDYEKDWINLKKHQEKKDLYIMNDLIAHLRPCVEKKDIACIKKFFPDPMKDDYLADWFVGYEIPDIKIDDELIEELKACLDYKNLLPHLYASRGLKKACIFHYRDRVESFSDSKMKIINVTYPEAVRIFYGFSIYMVPDNK